MASEAASSSIGKIHQIIGAVVDVVRTEPGENLSNAP